MDLVYDIDTIPAYLRRDTDLIHKGLDILNSIVGRGIKLMDTVGPSLCERLARLTSSARFHIRRRIGTVYHLCKDTGCRGLTDTSRAAEKICVRQLPSQDGVLECLSYIILADKRPEGVRPVLSC